MTRHQTDTHTHTAHSKDKRYSNKNETQRHRESCDSLLFVLLSCCCRCRCRCCHVIFLFSYFFKYTTAFYYYCPGFKAHHATPHHTTYLRRAHISRLLWWNARLVLWALFALYLRQGERDSERWCAACVCVCLRLFALSTLSFYPPLIFTCEWNLS